jgi:arylsulfatase A-like enzyme
MLIEEGKMTLASLLQETGYSTSIIGKWHLGFGREKGFEEDRGDEPPNFWESRGSGPDWNGEIRPGPNEVGFDYSYVLPVANSFPPYVMVEDHYVDRLNKGNPITKLVSNNHGLMEGGDEARWKDEDLVDILTSKTIVQLERLAKEDSPFFLYYAPTQPHIGTKPHPDFWIPNERFRGSSDAGTYGDVIQELDWSVGEILKTLDRLNLRENTLVIFTSDNGAPEFEPFGHRPRGPVMRGGKGDILEGGHRVPFIARWPGNIEPGTTSAETVSLTDMLATFAALVDRKLPPGAGEDSYNVLPALYGEKLPDPDRPLVFSSGGQYMLCIRMGKWKLIDGQGRGGYPILEKGITFPDDEPPMQLYDLEADLGETNNLYNQHPEIVKMMKEKLEEIIAESN